MSSFEIVPASLRDTPARGGGGHIAPVHQALVDGETVFVPLNGRKVENVRNTMYVFVGSRGMRLRTRSIVKDGVEGLLAWAEERAS